MFTGGSPTRCPASEKHSSLPILPGGTPANAAASFAFRDTRPVELVTGLNLLMLVAAVTNHADTVSALATLVHAAGQHGIDNHLRPLRAAFSATHHHVCRDVNHRQVGRRVSFVSLRSWVPSTT